MRLTTVILIASLMQVYASGFAQRITINQRNVPLESVLKEIRKQSGYDFYYERNQMIKNQQITVLLKDASIDEALRSVLKDLPLIYSIDGNTIAIRKREPSSVDKMSAKMGLIVVRGRVIKSDGQPLSGATVVVKNSKKSTQTNIEGYFTFSDVEEDAFLQISYIGYNTTEIRASAELMIVKLRLSDSKLDEVQVMAYGTTSRRLATGNITTVTAIDLEKQPVMNPLLALAGRVPGMVVTPTSGYASGTVKIEIRGRSSLNPNFASEPLYIIDGVPLTYLNIGGTSDYTHGSSGIVQNGMMTPGIGQSPLFNFNPADISSIEVLKDADATAIYGSRGANGVILITTKKGKAGPARITADVSQGLSMVTRYWDMLSTKDYIKARKEAFKNDGIIPNVSYAPDLLVWDTTRYTNWQKELWGGTGKLTTIQAGMSGGDENTQFRLNSNYTRQTEILTASGSNKRAGVSFGLTNFALNRKLQTDLSINYSYTDVNAIATPGAVTLTPNAPSIYDSLGELNYKEWNDAGIGNSYPFGALKGIYNSQSNLLTANLNLSYQLYKGLQIVTSFGYNRSHNSMLTQQPISAQNPINNPMGTSIVGSNDNQNWSIEPQVKYKIEIGKGTLTTLVGTTLQASVAKGLSIYGLGYNDDNLLGSIALAPMQFPMDTYGKYKYAAVFGRITYNWDDKYIVNISGRRDGSSRFGPGNQYGNFGSIGGAWIASQEPWFKNILPSYISFVKLRGSYGITGSDGVGDYQYLTQWSSLTSSNQTIYSYAGKTPLVSQHAVNPDYHWEVNKKLEGALSISFLNDRINLEAAVYRNRCDNQLTQYPTPLFTGFDQVTANWPAKIQNSGWELSVIADVIQAQKFKWNVSLQGSVNKNVLLDYPDLQHSPYASQYIIGKPINSRYLLHYIGVDPQTGQYAYEDYNRDGKITINNSGQPGTGNDDRYISVNIDPKFTGTIGSNFSYGDFQLSFFMQYVNQKGLNASFAGMNVGAMANIPQEVFDNHWSYPGQQAKYARFSNYLTTSDENITKSDQAYTDASFLRLNNVSFSYQLPKSVFKNENRRLKVYMNAQNLWVFTKYKGIDPTMQNFGSMPPARVIVAGLSLTL